MNRTDIMLHLKYWAGVLQDYSECLALWDRMAKIKPLSEYGKRAREEVQAVYDSAKSEYDRLDALWRAEIEERAEDARDEAETLADALV
jgi:hypothetical protein